MGRTPPTFVDLFALDTETLVWHEILPAHSSDKFSANYNMEALGSALFLPGSGPTVISKFDVSKALLSIYKSRLDERPARVGLTGLLPPTPSASEESLPDPAAIISFPNVKGLRRCFGIDVSNSYTQQRRIPGTRFLLLFGGSPGMLPTPIRYL